MNLAMSHFDWKAMASILKSSRRESEETQGGRRVCCIKSRACSSAKEGREESCDS